jgi:hypothetical protein
MNIATESGSVLLIGGLAAKRNDIKQVVDLPNVGHGPGFIIIFLCPPFLLKKPLYVMFVGALLSAMPTTMELLMRGVGKPGPRERTHQVQ